MGSDPNESGGRKVPKRPPTGISPDFWTFHPKEADKDAIKALALEADSGLTVLDEETKRGIVFTLTRTKQGDALCLIARNRFDGYGEGQALSVFHSDVFKAVAAMAYVLRVLHPEWPAKRATSIEASFDW